MPETHSVVQTGEDIVHAGSRVTIPQPAQLNSPPQFVAESEPSRCLRFLRANPFRDRMNDQNVRLELEVGVVPAQDLGIHWSIICDSELLAQMPTS